MPFLNRDTKDMCSSFLRYCLQCFIMMALFCEKVYSCVPLLPVAKSRDATDDKLDSEVVPKVARMTISGKKQTMGFDVPRYLTRLRPFPL